MVIRWSTPNRPEPTTASTRLSSPVMMTSSGPLWSMEYSGAVCTRTHAPTMFSAIRTPTTGTAAPAIIAMPPTNSKRTLAGPRMPGIGMPIGAKSAPTPERPPAKLYMSMACPIMMMPRPMRASRSTRSRAVLAPGKSTVVMVTPLSSACGGRYVRFDRRGGKNSSFGSNEVVLL
ncbi:hypothetical protein BJF90_19235 [Pseudonocardia sp. CNS-004]|nr:hypothetical protein BJF90_19235 [Pseudonocardia sp. CNS-004]